MPRRIAPKARWGRRATSIRSMSRGDRLILLLATLLVLPAAFSAGVLDPPRNDVLLHGLMVEGAAEALRTQGWTAFQDPWIGGLEGGFPYFHHYPHAVHQAVAAASVWTGVDAWRLLGLAIALAVLLLPAGVFLGCRVLLLSPRAASLAAFAMAVSHSVDRYAHSPLAYSRSGVGLYAQGFGMLLTAVAFPVVVAACSADGLGLKRWAPWKRLLAASLLASLVLRTNLPSAWVLAIAAGIGVLAAPMSELAGRVGRGLIIAAIAGVLSLGFLLPFVADLGALPHVAFLEPELLRSLGARRILERLFRGGFFDGSWLPLLTALVLAGAGLGLRRGGVERALALAFVAFVLLLFGRETWGLWMDSLPLIGRFHDPRYVPGLALVGMPLAGIALEWGWLRVEGRKHEVLMAAVVLGLLGGLQIQRSKQERRTWRSEDGEALAAELAAGIPTGLRVALGTPDPDVGRSSMLSLLRRQGVWTVGRNLHHYVATYDLSLLWWRWVAGEAPTVDRKLAPGDLHLFGVDALLLPPGRDRPPIGLAPSPWQRAQLAGGWSAVSSPAPTSRLVRSDLHLRTATPSLFGADVEWFLQGQHLRGQHPSVGPQPAAAGQREADPEARDPGVFAGLGVAGPLGKLTGLQARSDGGLDVGVQVDREGAWLLFDRSWHPGWRVSVDGSPSSFRRLLPGSVGVPLPPGQHHVELAWTVPAWRGPWAAANLFLYLLALPLLWRRESQ